MNEVFEAFASDEVLVGIFFDELGHRGGGPVINRNLKAAAFHIKHKILAHHGQTNQSEVTFLFHGNILLLAGAIALATPSEKGNGNL